MNLGNVILHCMTVQNWEKRKSKRFWGEENIAVDGFIHCSSIEYFWRITENFSSVNEPLLLVCIDKTKLTAELKYEDGDNCGRYYPHVYGPINNDAVICVLPYLRDKNGNYVKNPELSDVEDK